MYLLLIILIVIAAILLSFIVLIQNSKGGGLSSGFSSSNQIMGVRKTQGFSSQSNFQINGCFVKGGPGGDFPWKKAHWIRLPAIVVLSIILTFIFTMPRLIQLKALLFLLKQHKKKEENKSRMNTHRAGSQLQNRTAPGAGCSCQQARAGQGFF